MPVCISDIWNDLRQTILRLSVAHIVFIHTNKENAKRGCQSGVPYHLQFRELFEQIYRITCSTYVGV
jgi:hypothetical protein